MWSPKYKQRLASGSGNSCRKVAKLVDERVGVCVRVDSQETEGGKMSTA